MTLAEILAILDGAGYNIIRNLLSILWQSSLIFLAAYIITSSLRKHNDSIRHYVWFFAMLAVPLIPVFTIVMNNIDTPRTTIPVIPSYQPQQTILNYDKDKTLLSQESHKITSGDYSSLSIQPPAEQAYTISSAEIRKTRIFYPWAFLTFIYTAGVLFFFMVIIYGRYNITKWMNASRNIKDSGVIDIFRIACRQIDYDGSYLLREGKNIYSPLSFGVFRKTIILPEKFADSVSPPDLYTIALHEISHLKRNDPLIYTVVAVIRALFFFHPLVWYASEKIVELSEYSCDDNVLKFTQDPFSYAKMLAKIAGNLLDNAVQTNLAAGAIFSKNNFLRRVEVILSDRSAVIRKLSLVAVSGILALSCISMVIALALPLGEADSSNGEPVNVTGKVINNNKPVQDAAIYLETYDSRNKTFKNIEKIGVTGRDGSFSFKIGSFSLNENYKWAKPTVIAYSPEYSVGWQKLIDNSALDNVTIKITGAGTVTGTVRDTKGNPVKGALLTIAGIRLKDDTERLNQLGSFENIDKDLNFVSGDNGEFSITNLPENSLISLVATAKDYAKEFYKFEIESGSKDIEFVLKPGGRITGKVTFGDTGKPAKDIFVNFRGWGVYGPVKTDRNGIYVVESVAPGKFTAYISSGCDFPEWVAEPVETVMIEEGKTTGDIDFKLIKGGILTGKLTASDTGEPVQGHTVSADPENQRLSITFDSCKTDRNGIFRLRVPPGKIRINTQAPSGLKKSSDFRLIDAVEGETVSGIDFAFDRGLSVAVTTLSPEGNPVEGTAVKWTNTMDLPPKKITGKDGSCVFTGFGEGDDLEVYAENSKLKLKGHGAIKAAKDARLEIKMEKYKTFGVTGHVLDSDGNPIKDAKIYLLPRIAMVGVRETTSRTKSDGIYDVDNLIIGNDYTLTIEADGYAAYDVPVHKLIPEEQADTAPNPFKTSKPVHNVYLDKADRWLEGTLVDDEGNPVKGARINNTNSVNNFVTVFTDPNGHFRMDKLVRSFENRVSIVHDDYGFYEFTLVPTNSEQKLTLIKNHWKLTGKVVDSENKPVTGAQISFQKQTRESGFVYMGGNKTDSKGDFIIEPIVDKELDVTIFREDIGFKKFHIKTDEGPVTLVFDKPDEDPPREIEFDSRKLVFLEGQNPPEIDASKWLNGSSVKLKSLKGKIVVLDFCACEQRSFDKLRNAINAIQKEYGSKGVVVIGIHENTDDTSKIQKAIDELGLTYRIAVDKKGADSQSAGRTFDRFGMYKQPEREELATLTVIDKTGKTHQNIHIFDLDRALKEMLRGGK